MRALLLTQKNIYIDCIYKKIKIEISFVMGDGASYIKAGTEWIAKSVLI